MKLDFFDMVSVDKHTGTMDSWCGSNADCNYFELKSIDSHIGVLILIPFLSVCDGYDYPHGVALEIYWIAN